MSYRDRDNGCPVQVPSGMEKLGKAIESTLWVHQQLQLLERIPSCEAKNYLQSELKLVLACPDPMLKAASEMQLKAQVEQLKSELYEAQGEIRRLHELELSPEPDVSSASGSNSLKKFGISVLAIIVLIIVWRYIPNS